MIATVWVLALVAAASEAPSKEDLSSKRLLLIGEYATAKVDRLRKEEALKAVHTTSFDAAGSQTLRQLAEDLKAAEQRLADARNKSSAGAPQIRDTEKLVAALVDKVRHAREDLVQFFESEVQAALSREKELEDAIREVQERIEAASKPLEPPAAKPVEASAAPAGESPRIPPEPKPGDSRDGPTDELRYLYLGPGSFSQGCVAADTNCRPDEKPARTVALTKGFWIGRDEVTVEAYRKFVAATGRALPKPTQTNPEWRETQQPIARVAHEDATAYCAWAGGRLPTEAEWEYAARAGKADSIYPWGNDADHERANFLGRSRRGGRDRYEFVAQVRSFSPNDWGLYDLIGNLSEWVSDYYEPAYPLGPVTDPRGPEKGTDRVVRGGSFAGNPREIRASAREHFSPSEASNRIGFRCVIER